MSPFSIKGIGRRPPAQAVGLGPVSRVPAADTPRAVGGRSLVAQRRASAGAAWGQAAAQPRVTGGITSHSVNAFGYHADTFGRDVDPSDALGLQVKTQQATEGAFVASNISLRKHKATMGVLNNWK